LGGNIKKDENQLDWLPDKFEKMQVKPTKSNRQIKYSIHPSFKKKSKKHDLITK